MFDTSNVSPATPETRRSVVDPAARQDAVAFETLVRIYGPIVYYWLRRKHRIQAHDAQDLTQQVFVRLQSSLHRFSWSPGSPPPDESGSPERDGHVRSESNSGRTSFRGWLYTLTRNIARDFHRKSSGAMVKTVGGSSWNHRLQEIACGRMAASARDELPDPEAQAEAGSARVRMQFAENAMSVIRERFSEQSINAFFLHRVQRRTHREVAEMLSMSPDAVRAAVYRISRELRALAPEIDVSSAASGG